jgi:prevent-host-death family protein
MEPPINADTRRENQKYHPDLTPSLVTVMIISTIMVAGGIMLKTVSAIKVRQNLGQVMNEVFLKDDEYIVERSGKPLVAIIPIEKYLTMKNSRTEFFRLYDSLQSSADNSLSIDADIAEALTAARS